MFVTGRDSFVSLGSRRTAGVYCTMSRDLGAAEDVDDVDFFLAPQVSLDRLLRRNVLACSEDTTTHS